MVVVFLVIVIKMIIPENISHLSNSKKNKPIIIKILIAELFIIAKNEILK